MGNLSERSFNEEDAEPSFPKKPKNILDFGGSQLEIFLRFPNQEEVWFEVVPPRVPVVTSSIDRHEKTSAAPSQGSSPFVYLLPAPSVY